MKIKSSTGTALTICSERYTIPLKCCHFILNCAWLSTEGKQGVQQVWLSPAVSQVTAGNGTHAITNSHSSGTACGNQLFKVQKASPSSPSASTLSLGFLPLFLLSTDCRCGQASRSKSLAVEIWYRDDTGITHRHCTGCLCQILNKLAKQINAAHPKLAEQINATRPLHKGALEGQRPCMLWRDAFYWIGCFEQICFERRETAYYSFKLEQGFHPRAFQIPTLYVDI